MTTIFEPQQLKSMNNLAITPSKSVLNIYLWAAMIIITIGIIGCSDDDRIFNEDGLCLVEIDGIFQDVELDEYPEYLNEGNEGFTSGLYLELKYPAEARANGIEGTCLLNYEITEEGRVENIVVIQDPGAGIGNASVQSLFSTTEGISFKAGILNNRSVRVKKDLNIIFRLEG